MQTISKNYETCHVITLGYLHCLEKIIVNSIHLHECFLLTSTSPLPKIIPFRVKSAVLYHFFFYVQYMNLVPSILLHVTLRSTYAPLFYFFLNYSQILGVINIRSVRIYPEGLHSHTMSVSSRPPPSRSTPPPRRIGATPPLPHLIQYRSCWIVESENAST